MVPKFQVATACFSCSPPDLNLSKLSSLAGKATKFFFFKIILNLKSKFRGPLSHGQGQMISESGMSASLR
jgi:hypothetical protein